MMNVECHQMKVTEQLGFQKLLSPINRQQAGLMFVKTMQLLPT